MHRQLVVLGVTLLALSAMAAPAAAATTECNSTSDITGATFDDVVVPRDGRCVLINSTVTGDVRVKRGAYFQATNTDIAGKVSADDALTLFIDTDSTVGRSVRADDTAEVFIFNATIGKGIDVDDSTAVVQICGTTVTKGDVEVRDSSFDILIGDPQAEGCAGNTIAGGDLELRRNIAEVEFVVRGNTIAGDLEVNHNRGSAAKFVEDNTGGDELECFGNEDPFTASGNTGFNDVKAQCRKVLICANQDVHTGVSVDEVIVPENVACTLIDSTVSDDVKVGAGAFFQADGTDIGDDVRARDAVTLFLNTGTSVGGDVQTHNTQQVFVFNVTVGDDVEIEKTTEVVNVCGATVGNDLEVKRSSFDLLIGDPQAKDCAGNAVGDDLEVERNVAEVELIVRGNTVGDDLEVERNTGSAAKAVESNTGGDELECFDNTDPFTASGNTGFARPQGQCAPAAPIATEGI